MENPDIKGFSDNAEELFNGFQYGMDSKNDAAND
ncbi:hypothetical protein L915_04448 [Phytophthora nicotianae]|uniref:Uncharacterized protein n=1 Tax=Phytophthora nicotianae TaxID=4792 RepID=W2JGD2_PHYNI|nr:hypothetical protein L915_04448 [Phytophthora nicotianae]ETL45520.1 hypothetical protein L916_04418 [Phytophthora nicotianae]ETM51863.1 hypothetical protein L914_04393 [Phytophthora nicotianae]